MIRRLITRYGLAFHLALLAGLPVALTPFLSRSSLATLILWLSAYALLGLVAEPSVRIGEHLSLARRRVLVSIVKDPFFWFCLVMVAFAWIRMVNGGIAMFYDAEKSEWLVRDPSCTFLPSSAKDAGYLPFAVSVGVLVLLMGIRHGIGLAARLSFSLVGSFIVAIGGLAAVTCVCLGVEPFVSVASSSFGKMPLWGSLFGVWMMIALSSGLQAEARKWKVARLPFCISVGGTAAGLLFFSPALQVAAWAVFALFLVIFGLIHLGRTGALGAVARSFSLLVLGFAVPAFLLALFAPEAVQKAKEGGLDIAIAFPETYVECNEILSGLARKMWLPCPWGGVGEGAFGLHVPFLAERTDWDVIPPKPLFAMSAYWTILAERGISGCLVLALALGFLVWTYLSRAITSFLYLRRCDDADVFVFAVPIIVWVPPVAVILVALEALWSPLFSLEVVFMAVATVLALGAASFPKAKKSSDRNSADSGAESAVSEK